MPKLKLMETDIDELRKENERRKAEQGGYEYNPPPRDPQFSPKQQEAVDSIKEHVNKSFFEKTMGVLRKNRK